MIKTFYSAVKSSDESGLKELSKRLENYYQSAATSEYWSLASAANETYPAATRPYHADFIRRYRANPGRVIDLGCGSANIVKALGAPHLYVGVDWSVKQTARNKARIPDASFVSSNIYKTSFPARSFDWAVSFFVLEHCVYPQQLLVELLRLVRPGGRICLICPHLRPWYMNSLWFGHKPMSARRKLLRFELVDLCREALDRAYLMKRRLHAAHTSGGEFLIYSDPRCFHAPYFSDCDAVYWSYWPEIKRYFENSNCSIETSHRELGEPIGRIIYTIVTVHE